MRRKNVAGGSNYVAPPDCAGMHPGELGDEKILSKFTLENVLDSFVVDDARVSHHVDEVYPIIQDQACERSVLLVDFTPMMPQFV